MISRTNTSNIQTKEPYVYDDYKMQEDTLTTSANLLNHNNRTALSTKIPKIYYDYYTLEDNETRKMMTPISDKEKPQPAVSFAYSTTNGESRN